MTRPFWISWTAMAFRASALAKEMEVSELYIDSKWCQQFKSVPSTVVHYSIWQDAAWIFPIFIFKRCKMLRMCFLWGGTSFGLLLVLGLWFLSIFTGTTSGFLITNQVRDEVLAEQQTQPRDHHVPVGWTDQSWISFTWHPCLGLSNRWMFVMCLCFLFFNMLFQNVSDIFIIFYDVSYPTFGWLLYSTIISPFAGITWSKRSNCDPKI